MIRVVVFLVAAGLLALGVVWLADRPGQVAITWLGYRTDTSVMVAVMAIVAVAIVAVMLWSVARFMLRSPKLFSLVLRERKRRKGYDAISRGLIAIGAGDARAAQRFADNAEQSLPGEPLALLLRAQTAQLTGDRAGAEAAFRAMAERADTRLLGLRGLYVEAQRRNDPAAARLFAEKLPRRMRRRWPGPGRRCWNSAARRATGTARSRCSKSNRKSGMLDRAAYRRQRAVLLTARALARRGERPRHGARARASMRRSSRPTLVPAAALAGRLLAEAGERRKAAQDLETAWKANPHPDLAETYAHVRLSDSARDRLTRVQALARMAPGHVESALAVARAALDAREFAIAREALRRCSREPTQRVAHADGRTRSSSTATTAARANGWRARSMRALDPAWTADGFVSDRWLPVSPVTGRLDAFQWKVPVAELGDARAGADRGAAGAGRIRNCRARNLPREVASPPLGNVAPENGGALSAPHAHARPVPRVAPIIPLTQVPDDPGPEPEAETDVEVATEPRSRDAWQRIRQLFR